MGTLNRTLITREVGTNAFLDEAYPLRFRVLIAVR